MSSESDETDELQFGIGESGLASETETDAETADEQSTAGDAESESAVSGEPTRSERSGAPVTGHERESTPNAETQSAVADGRQSSDSPLAALPADLSEEHISTKGAREFADLDADAIYESTIEPYQFDRSGAHDRRSQKMIFVREPVEDWMEDVHKAMSRLYENEDYHECDTQELLIILALKHLDELPEVAADLGFGLSLNDYVQSRQG